MLKYKIPLIVCKQNDSKDNIYEHIYQQCHSVDIFFHDSGTIRNKEYDRKLYKQRLQKGFAEETHKNPSGKFGIHELNLQRKN